MATFKELCEYHKRRCFFVFSLYLVTSSGCPTRPRAWVVLLCSKNLAYFSSSRPPLAIILLEWVQIPMILRLLQFGDNHPRIHRVNANFFWRQLQRHTSSKERVSFHYSFLTSSFGPELPWRYCRPILCRILSHW